MNRSRFFKHMTAILPVIAAAVVLSACGTSDKGSIDMTTHSEKSQSVTSSGESASDMNAAGKTAVTGTESMTDTSVSGESTSSGILSSFKAIDLDGNSKDAGIFKDHRLTMVNVWATFCSPCINELPELGSISSDYADKGFQIIGIVSDIQPDESGNYDKSQVAEAHSLILQTGALYTHLLPSDDINTQLLSSVVAVPTTIFVDENGNQVGKAYTGARSKADWEKIIKSLLPEA